MKSQLRLLLGLVLLAVAMVASPGSADLGSALAPVSAQGLELSLDTDISDGPCADIDSELSTSVGESFQVAVCVEGLPSGMIVFQFDVMYDDKSLLAPEVADEGLGLDDNPDANAGATTWGVSLGEKDQVDCSSGQVAFPMGDRNNDPGEGDAFISCLNLFGPWPLGGEVANGVIAVITFKALKTGTDTLALASVQLGNPQAIEMGSCNPTITTPMSCNEATIQVVKQDGGGDWLLPILIGIVVAVAVVGLLSLVFHRRRRQAA